MTTTELIELLKKYEFGGATGRAREVSIQVGNNIYGTDIKAIGTGDGLITELTLVLSTEREWIPCSERLPEEDYWLGESGKQFSENVFVTVVNHDDDDIWTDTTHTIDGEWMLELPRHCEITAWMSLPEPYKAEEEE